jgi:hypothetical protein
MKNAVHGQQRVSTGKKFIKLKDKMGEGGVLNRMPGTLLGLRIFI